jgi:hypothetical protein
VQRAFDGLDQEMRRRLRVLFDRTGIKLGEDVVEITAFADGSCRFKLQNMRPAVRHDEDSEAWNVVGYHGTTTQGIHGILKDRCLHGSRELPVVYMLASQSAMGNIAEMCSLFRQVAKGHKNQCNIICEVHMKSRWASLTSGGTDLDVKRCWETYRNGDKTFQYQGAHMRTAGENRWCFHESLVHLAAIWVRVKKSCQIALGFGPAAPVVKKNVASPCGSAWEVAG